VARQPRLLLLHQLHGVGDRAPNQPLVLRHTVAAVRPHLMGVRRPDPDIELHGEPDVDVDDPEAPAPAVADMREL
jgi:hypothetical protein